MKNVSAMLTDLYQLTMVYAYWLANVHTQRAVFDLFFRKCPFNGQFAVYAGLEESLDFIENFGFSGEDIDYLKTVMPDAHPQFWAWLRELNCSGVEVYAADEGSVLFPRVPIMRIEGDLAVAQLLETTLLNLNNFGTLCATNAARHRIAAGYDKSCLEFGLRRAQGPDGGMTASRSSYIGGFDATSNVAAGKRYGIPNKGTHAHAFVQKFRSLDEIWRNPMFIGDPLWESFIKDVLAERDKLGFTKTNEGELAAFITYARAFPDNFLALVDTYDTLRSGVPNFICVALVLKRMGYDPLGIRIDSGDLAFLSKQARKMMDEVGLTATKIAASNDINESVLYELNREGHKIDIFGIGTALATCQAQPALGGVYKLVEINGHPRIKLSEDDVKITIPGRKEAYRLYGADGKPLIDVMIIAGQDPPQVGVPFRCRHPFISSKRSDVTPSRVQNLLNLKWDGKHRPTVPVSMIRQFSMEQVLLLRDDVKRPLNPTPYKVGVSSTLFDFVRDLRENEAPIGELK